MLIHMIYNPSFNNPLWANAIYILFIIIYITWILWILHKHNNIILGQSLRLKKEKGKKKMIWKVAKSKGLFCGTVGGKTVHWFMYISCAPPLTLTHMPSAPFLSPLDFSSDVFVPFFLPLFLSLFLSCSFYS